MPNMVGIRAARNDVVIGNLKAAIELLKPNEWVSFQVRAYSKLEGWYTSAGGKLK